MSNFRCSATSPCHADLCCGFDGYCTTTATACSVSKGCISGCKSIPDPGTCSTQISPAGFTSSLYPQLNVTDTTTPLAPSLVSGSSSCNTTTYALQPCDLVDLMGGATACPNCLYYYDRVREAIEAYGMSQYVGCTVPGTGTGSRLAAFAATLRHETAELGTLFQPLDGGSGGIHMLPVHFQVAAAGIPRLADALTAEFGPMDPVWTQIAAGNTTAQRMVGNLVMRPEHAFLTVGWWFVAGAQSVLSDGCTDLRRDADGGLGSGSSDTAASGFYKVSRCVFGTLKDEGLSQRITYYKQASAIANVYSPTFTRNPTVTPTPDPSDSGATLGVTLGSIAGVIIVLGLAGMLYMKRRSRRTTLTSVEAPLTAIPLSSSTNSEKQQSPSPSPLPAESTTIAKSGKHANKTKQSQEHLAARQLQSGPLDQA